MEELKLSKKYSIYKNTFAGKYSREAFLDLVRFNHLNTVHTNNNSVWIEVESPIIEEVNRFVMNNITNITGRHMIDYAKHNWVYTQRKGFDMEWMHQHIFVHPPGRSTIHADYTFTYYLQTTDEIEGDEGMIVFEDENNKRHKFLPVEGDVFLFPADIRHTAIPTPKSVKERIVFAGSFCIDIYNQKTYEKSSI